MQAQRGETELQQTRKGAQARVGLACLAAAMCATRGAAAKAGLSPATLEAVATTRPAVGPQRQPLIRPQPPPAAAPPRRRPAWPAMRPAPPQTSAAAPPCPCQPCWAGCGGRSPPCPARTQSAGGSRVGRYYKVNKRFEDLVATRSLPRPPNQLLGQPFLAGSLGPCLTPSPCSPPARLVAAPNVQPNACLHLTAPLAFHPPS